jgi:CBS domain-containing protein
MHPSINRSVITIDESATALAAARLMKESETGSLMVVNSSGKLTGLLTGRDLVLKVLAENKSPNSVRVRDVMSGSPMTAPAEDLDIRELAKILGRARVRRLPIVDGDGRPVGIITLEDMLVHAGDVIHSLSTAVSSYLTVARLKSAHFGGHD